MTRFMAAFSFLPAFAAIGGTAAPAMLRYAPAARGEVVDEFYGIKVPDLCR